MRRINSKGKALVTRTSKKDMSSYASLPQLHGVHYTEGLRTETNGQVASMVQEEYAPELEGKTVKDGKVVGGRYPSVKGLLDRIECKGKDGITVEKTVNVDELIDTYLSDVVIAYSVARRSTDSSAVVEYEGYLFPLETFAVSLIELKKRGFAGECSLTVVGYEPSHGLSKTATFFIQSEAGAVILFSPSLAYTDEYLEFDAAMEEFVGHNGFSESVLAKVNEMYKGYYR